MRAILVGALGLLLATDPVGADDLWDGAGCFRWSGIRKVCGPVKKEPPTVSEKTCLALALEKLPRHESLQVSKIGFFQPGNTSFIDGIVCAKASNVVFDFAFTCAPDAEAMSHGVTRIESKNVYWMTVR